MASNRIEGLPNLPGNRYVDPTLTDFRKTQIFEVVNGFRVPKQFYNGIGSVPIPEKCVTMKDFFDIYNYDPSMTYGKPKAKAPPIVVPAYVSLEKKVLKFNGYYKETVNDSPDEIYRVRPVDLFYYLVDDTIMIVEPVVQNSGLMQGVFLKRHKIPKNDIVGETWHWKDLNLKCDIMFYGRVFRLVDADPWTKEYYASEGVIMNEPEIVPVDPYTDKRYLTLQKQTFTSPDVMCNPRKKYMEFEKKALRFMCVWDDRHSEYGSLRKYELLYHLADDCVEVMEVQEPNSGRDPFKLLLHKIRLPKNWKDLPLTFPVSLEPSQREIVEYYEPKDLKIGETIMVFGRRFLIYDMDEATKKFYRDYYGYTDFTPICIDPKKPPKKELQPPPWNGWGSPEDSLQSWLHIVPRRPKYDAMKRLVFELKVLKFGAVLDSTRPEDQGREFTISYRLVDDKIAVYERPVRNSGWPGGKFLDFSRLQKAGSSNDNPVYYGPHDFYIGAMLDFHGHRFCLNAADTFVLEFIEKNPDCFPEHVKQNLKEYFECEKKQNPQLFAEKPCDPGKPVCEEALGEGFFEHLGLGSERHEVHPCAENPNPIPLCYDWDMCRKLGYNCGVQRPEPGVDDVEGIEQVCDKPCPGNPDMFEMKECAVCRPSREVPPEPIMPNPKWEDGTPKAIDTKEEYFWRKDHRFDCYNPPDLEKQKDIQQKRVRFFCPCEPCDDGADKPKQGH